jgi:hypothetical protein
MSDCHRKQTIMSHYLMRKEDHVSLSNIRTAMSRCRLRKEDYVPLFDVMGGTCVSFTNENEDHGSLAKQKGGLTDNKKG